MNNATWDPRPVAAQTRTETRTVTPASSPGFLVWLLSMKWRMEVDRTLAEFGLTHAQYSFLAALLALEPSGRQPTQSQLAHYTGLEPLYVSKLARALDLACLIDRRPHPEDSRAVQLSLTEVGREAINTAVGFIEPLFDELLDPLGGLGAERTRRFARDLTALLDVPPRPLT